MRQLYKRVEERTFFAISNPASTLAVSKTIPLNEA